MGGAAGYETKRKGAGGAGEGDHVRRVSRFLPAGQAAILQPLLLLDVHREDGGSLSRRAVRLPRVSQGDESPCRRRGGAPAGLLRGEDKGPARQDGQGGGEGGGALRAVRGGKVGRLLPTVRRVHLRRLLTFAHENEGLSGHVVASLKKGGVKNIPLKEAPAAACADHGEPKSLFCFDCERLICRDCTIIEHKEHTFEFVKKCAPEGRRRLRESLAPLQEVRADMAGAEKRVVSEEAKVERQREEVCGAIQQSFEQLKAVLERRKAELVGKVCYLAQEKKNALAAQKTVLQVAQKEIQLLTELVERNVESTSDQDLMSIRRQLQSKMEEEEEHHRQLSLEPTATADIACHLPSPDDIPKRLGSVFNKNTPHAFLDPVTSYELGSPVQVTLCAPRVSLGDISAGLKCVADPSSSSLEGEVVENGVGVFSISVTFGVRGRHDLTVKVRGEEIEGSPFRVFVKFPLSQLGQEDQTRMVGDFSEPWGIAVNNKQQLIVVESSKIWWW